MNNLLTPSFTEERTLQAQGYCHIAGIDEVGRGALAGPVVAGAVIFPQEMDQSCLDGVRDSKQLTPPVRETLAGQIRKAALAIGIGSVPHSYIDLHGIVRATELAMKLAVKELSPRPNALLIDYMRLPGIDLPQKGVVEGDSLCFSISAASIIAKVARDGMMTELDTVYPGYGFAKHKGYGTREHLECLARLGPCAIHRMSFQPVGRPVKKI